MKAIEIDRDVRSSGDISRWYCQVSSTKMLVLDVPFAQVISELKEKYPGRQMIFKQNVLASFNTLTDADKEAFKNL